MAGGSTGVVVAAMVANAGIAVLKFFGFLLTGSPSMLAETYHSISDTGNQVLLLVGIKYSAQEPTRLHPFGYGKAQFFISQLSHVNAEKRDQIPSRTTDGSPLTPWPRYRPTS